MNGWNCCCVFAWESKLKQSLELNKKINDNATFIDHLTIAASAISENLLKLYHLFYDMQVHLLLQSVSWILTNERYDYFWVTFDHFGTK